MPVAGTEAGYDVVVDVDEDVRENSILEFFLLFSLQWPILSSS